MLFTNIQLDDFQPTLARFIERLEIEGAEEREWVMMAVINVSSVLEYGKPSGILKKNGAVGGKGEGMTGIAGMRVMMAKRVIEEEKMDVDGDNISPIIQQHSPTSLHADAADGTELPVSFKLALQLTFAMLTHVLHNPTRKASQFARPNLNPYLTVVLTFLATMLKHPATLGVLERTVPWEALAQFMAMVPRNVMASQFQGRIPGERWALLTSNCAPPLPEDWCLRGMEWVGRRVFERGFWKSGEERKPEVELLDKSEAWEATDGIIEDGEDDENDLKNEADKKKSDNERRWVRVLRCGVGIADVVDGFTWVQGTRDWRVEGALAAKVELWQEEDRIELEEEDKRRMGRRWADDSMDVDEGGEDDMSEESGSDEDDSEDVKTLKALFFFFPKFRQLTALAGKTALSAKSLGFRPIWPGIITSFA
jgi:protein SMG6